MLIDENIVWINTNLRSIILLKIALFLYNSMLSSLLLQLLPYKLYAWSRSIIIALYEMSFKSDLRRITSQNTFFPAFYSFLSGSAFSVFLVSLCRLEVRSSVLISTPKLSLCFSVAEHFSSWWIILFVSSPMLLRFLVTVLLRHFTCILPFGFDFPTRHLSCSLSWFLLGSELLICGGASNPGVTVTSFSLLWRFCLGLLTNQRVSRDPPWVYFAGSFMFLRYID